MRFIIVYTALWIKCVETACCSAAFVLQMALCTRGSKIKCQIQIWFSKIAS